VGKQACENGKVKFAFQDRLWRIFRGLGESMFGEKADDEETAESERMKNKRRLSHVARFYAFLIVDGALNITILKPLNLLEMNPWTALFVEWLTISLLRACRGSAAKQSSKLAKVFGRATRVPSLAAGLDWLFEKKLRRSKLLAPEEMKKLKGVRAKAQSTVQAQAADED